MNNLEINYLLRHNKYTNRYFLNVYSADKLPKRINKCSTKIIIANFSPSTSPGTHWVAFLFKPKIVEFFDPAGDISLRQNKLFQDFIARNRRRKMIYNTNALQSLHSDTCGEWCCIYTLYRSKNKSFKNFLKSFNFKDKLEGDKRVRYLLAKHFLKKVISA